MHAEEDSTNTRDSGICVFISSSFHLLHSFWIMSSADYDGDSSYSRSSVNPRSRATRGASGWSGAKEGGIPRWR